MVKQEQEPQKIISDKTSFEITIPNLRKSIFMSISPDGLISTKVGDLTSAKESDIRLETGFMQLAADYISAALGSKSAALQIDTTDAVGPNLSAISLEEQVGDAVKTLYQKGYPEKKIKKLVMDQGKLFLSGETHMGEMPSAVKEIVVNLSTRIEDYFASAEIARKKRKI